MPPTFEFPPNPFTPPPIIPPPDTIGGRIGAGFKGRGGIVGLNCVYPLRTTKNNNILANIFCITHLFKVFNDNTHKTCILIKYF